MTGKTTFRVEFNGRRPDEWFLHIEFKVEDYEGRDAEPTARLAAVKVAKGLAASDLAPKVVRVVRTEVLQSFGEEGYSFDHQGKTR
jgi:hypothetical protein